MSEQHILHGDCRAILAELPEDSIDACITDPPYDLTANKKGGSGVASINLKSPYGRARIGTGNGPGGFMGKKWDGTGVAFDPDTWRAVYRVLKPGAYLLAFGGSRTYHRMACAVEDAGFEIRDQIMWIYGSGFPKSLNLDGDWEGWGTALKPAHEPIVVARKPLIGTVAENVLAHRTGALNIDASRIEVGDEQYTRNCSGDRGHAGTRDSGEVTSLRPGGGEASALGRWPANVIHDGSEEVVAQFPRKAARFFYCAKASRADRDEGCEHLGLTVADEQHARPRSELDDPRRAGTVPRANHHPTVKPTDLMRYLVRLVTPPGGIVLDPFTGSGSTGRGAILGGFNFIGIEQQAEYVQIARRRIAAILTPTSA